MDKKQCDPEKVQRLQQVSAAAQRLQQTARNMLDACLPSSAPSSSSKPTSRVSKPLAIAVVSVVVIGLFALLWFLVAGKSVGHAIRFDANTPGKSGIGFQNIVNGKFTAYVMASPKKESMAFEINVVYDPAMLDIDENSVWSNSTFSNQALPGLPIYHRLEDIPGNLKLLRIRGFNVGKYPAGNNIKLARVSFRPHAGLNSITLTLQNITMGEPVADFLDSDGFKAYTAVLNDLR